MQSAQQLSALVGLPSLVCEMSHQIPLLDARRAGAEMYGAPRLSFYELIRPNENALSRIVGDLLDPRGTHGQGLLFLNAFLNSLNLPRVHVRDVGGVRVCRELLTYKGRRIDIVVETREALLGIENKPWAGLSQNQLPDYHSDLKNRAVGKQFRLILLSDLKNESVRDGVINVQYRTSREQPSLHGLLSSVVGDIRAPSARTHVVDFIRYIDQQFGEGQVTEERDEPYVEAVQAEFDGGQQRGRRWQQYCLRNQRFTPVSLMKSVHSS